MQSFNVQAQQAISPNGETPVAGKEKTGADTARNGHSFLAILDKAIAGTMDGKDSARKADPAKKAGRGAGDTVVPNGEADTKKKPPLRGEKTALADNKALDSALAKAGPMSASQDRAQDKTRLRGSGKAFGAAEPSLADKLESERKVKDVETLAELLAFRGVGAQPGTQSLTEQGFGKDRASTRQDAKKTGIGAVGGAGDSILSRLSVVDLRQTATDKNEAFKSATKAERSAAAKTAANKSAAEKSVLAAQGENVSSAFQKNVALREDGSAEMTLGLKGSESGSTSSERSQVNGGSEGKTQNFASMLSEELRANSADLVKTGHIVLKDNNQGLIRLTLHPETLGNVRISLDLSDRKISGKIIVSSREAYEAFNENLDGLSKAFVEGGFESAGFDLSWSGSGNGGKEDLAPASVPFYASAVPDVMYGPESSDTMKAGSGSYRNQAVNVFA